MSVSIIITAHNQADTVGRTIDSALTQRCGDTEIIVVNDGSTDDTDGVLRRYGNAIKVITHYSSIGLYRSRFEAINAASNSWITFVDGDDFLAPAAIDRCLASADSTQPQIIQMSIMRRFRRLAGLTTPLQFQRYDTNRVFDAITHDYRLFPVQCCGKLYSAPLLKQLTTDHIDYNGFWGEDRLFNLAILSLNPKIIVCRQARYIYNWGGATSLPSDRLAEYITVYSLKREFLSQNGLLTPDIDSLLSKELMELIDYNTRQSINSGLSKAVIIDRLNNCGAEIDDPVEIYNRAKRSVSRRIKRLIRQML